jgi:hypothetical protein
VHERIGLSPGGIEALIGHYDAVVVRSATKLGERQIAAQAICSSSRFQPTMSADSFPPSREAKIVSLEPADRIHKFQTRVFSCCSDALQQVRSLLHAAKLLFAIIATREPVMNLLTRF